MENILLAKNFDKWNIGEKVIALIINNGSNIKNCIVDPIGLTYPLILLYFKISMGINTMGKLKTASLIIWKLK